MLKRKRRVFLIFSLAAGVILPLFFAAVILGGDWPLGGMRGAWEWHRFVADSGRLECWAAGIGAFIFGTYLAWRLDGGTFGRLGAVFVIMLILGCGAIADLALWSSGRSALAENALAQLDPFATGYLERGLAAEKPADLTRNFARLVLTPTPGEVPLHRHVHPPANVWLAHWAYRQLPPSLGFSLLPETGEDLQTLAAEGIIPPALARPQVLGAALNLTLLFMVAIWCGKALICYLLWSLRVKLPGLAALLVSFNCGAAVLFLGHYDSFYFLPAALSMVLLCIGICRRNLWSLAGAGTLVACGGMFTLGFGSLGLLGLLVVATVSEPVRRWRNLVAYALGGVAAVGLAAVAGANLPALAWQCWQNHRTFCAMAGRGWWPWVAFNFEDALLFAGVLPTLLIGGGWLLPPGHPFRRYYLWGAAMWLFLLFSGSARGEFGRLTALYLPVLLAAAGLWLGGCGGIRRETWFYQAAVLALGMGWGLSMLLRNTLKLVLID